MRTALSRSIWLVGALILATTAACNQGHVITDPVLHPGAGMSRVNPPHTQPVTGAPVRG